MGVASTLTIVFIVLKLIGVINWSWLWVLFPTIIVALFWLTIALITFISEVIKDLKNIKKASNNCKQKEEIKK